MENLLLTILLKIVLAVAALQFAWMAGAKWTASWGESVAGEWLVYALKFQLSMTAGVLVFLALALSWPVL